MSTRREKIYRCTMVTRGRTYLGHVRAWDEREAVLIFREELELTGVTVRGAIQATDVMARPEQALEAAAY
jgi:hypothetical protein